MKKSVFCVAVCCAATLFFTCANMGKRGNDVPGNKPGETPVTGNWVVLAEGGQCAIENAGQRLITSAAEMSAVWEEAFSGIDMAPAMPEVDFEKHHVVAAFMGMTSSAGYSIAFKSVSSNGVALQHNRPGPNCMTASVIEFPYAFIRVARFTTDRVEFKITETVVDCK